MTKFNITTFINQPPVIWNGTSKSFITRIILRLMQGKITKQAKVELKVEFKLLIHINLL